MKERRQPAGVGLLDTAMVAAAAVACGSLVLEHGFPSLPVSRAALSLVELGCALVFAGSQVAKLLVVPRPAVYLREHRLDFALLFVLAVETVVIVGLGATEEHRALERQGVSSPLWAFYVVLLQLYLLVVVVARSPLLHRLLLRLRLQPAQMLVASFLLLILVGAALLALPGASQDGGALPLVDALFTSTSAVCVTGLVVRDTGAQFSLFGTTVLLGLIQAGGLGILTITAALALLGGERLRGDEARTLGHALDAGRVREMRTTLGRVLASTLAIEAAGAGLLYLAWPGLTDDSLRRAAWATFHSVSAFCNAGFTLFPDNASLTAFVGDPLVNLTVGGLIVLGGLGFPVLADLAGFGLGLGRRARRRRLTRHSRWVLAATAVLIAAGTIAFHAFERHGVLAPLAGTERWIAAAFQSVTLRTAGFNSVDFAAIGLPAVTLSVLWMLIGGSPASTAGGLKTTTAAVVLTSLVGRPRVDPATRRRALRQALAYLAAFAFSTLLLAALRGALDDEVVFESASALGTVGLSMGLTAKLGTAAKLLLCLTMFAGRVGPVALAAALLRRRAPDEEPADPDARIQTA